MTDRDFLKVPRVPGSDLARAIEDTPRQRMTPAELRDRVNGCGHERHFFDRESMRFFGDTMRNYGVRDAGRVTLNAGGECEAWELYRKHPVRGGLIASAYFDKTTFARVFPAEEA